MSKDLMKLGCGLTLLGWFGVPIAIILIGLIAVAAGC